jgi:hypothetical protein
MRVRIDLHPTKSKKQPSEALKSPHSRAWTEKEGVAWLLPLRETRELVVSSSCDLEDEQILRHKTGKDSPIFDKPLSSNSDCHQKLE